MPALLPSDIEAIAQRVLRAYYKLPELRGQTVSHIDPELLSTKLLGLRIEYHVLSVSGFILGLTAKNRYLVKVYDNGVPADSCVLQKKTIFIDRYLHDNLELRGRYHFTLAHEASHHILWMLPTTKDLSRKGVLCYKANTKLLTDEEIQANALASALLMPASLVLEKLLNHGFGTEIKILNRIYDPRGYDRFCRIAEELGVSKTALCIRMRKLGVLRKEYLRDPYALFDVFPDNEPYVS